MWSKRRVCNRVSRWWKTEIIRENSMENVWGGSGKTNAAADNGDDDDVVIKICLLYTSRCV